MKFSFSTRVSRQLKRIKKEQPHLFNRIQKQLHLYENNPRHPSLRIHKLKGNLLNSWSLSVGENIRMLYYAEDNKAVFFLIGTHDEVYKH